ncbi:CoA pyrophosphatase [Beijerinckia sp. L45]|uniref:CoA pyrophosphatase n=1 Tax=Beijerinckia sp. L45 TaxID=1641855 RepID=UPI001FEF4E08|nr:CoA pyrophosphatase [Beijerinckia sp. L45]
MTDLQPGFGDIVASEPENDFTAGTADAAMFAPGNVFARIAARVPRTLAPEALDRAHIPLDGDHSLNAWDVSPDFLAEARVAAVLIGLVERDDGLHIILTQRASALRVHSGQIAFPGGKMDPEDSSPAATALREVFEEIGIPADRIEVLGYLGAYLTRTGFRIVPVIARIRPPFDLVLNPAEVVDTFEVPFAFLMSEANHELREREWKGLPRRFYAMPYGDRNIWGITAGILRNLYERLYR